MKDYEGRLTIDWGSSTVCGNRGTTEKPIISIQADEKKVFAGFENLILTYDELKEIVLNQLFMRPGILLFPPLMQFT